MAQTPAPGRRDRGGQSTSDASPRTGWRRWAWWLAIPGLFLALVLGAFLLVWMVQVPLPEDIAPGATTVLDRDGEVIGTLTGEATRKDVPFEEIPESTRLAVLAAEDRGFYTHGGVSALGILRAAVTNLRAGEVEEGGSTITQQYVKNAVVGTERTYLRKMREAALAIKVDRQYPKDTVLNWYLNTIYLGRGAYGIGAAAQTYFETTPPELTLNQSATLAGMISSPENLDPSENPEGAERRRVYVLDGMLEQGWITQAERDEAVDQGLPEVSQNSALATQTAPYYMDAVRRELTGALGDQAVAANLRVHTGLDLRMQRAAEQQVRDTVTDNELGVPELSGSLVSVDPQTGEVRAVVGGPDFQEQQFNVAVRGERQVGSTFKAFTLGAWLESGRSPEAVLPAPATIEVPDKPDGISNYGGQGYGQASVYDATAASINTVFVQMQQELAAEPIIDLGVRLGLPEDRFSPVPSMTLGVDGFSPLAMAEAFATFAAEGVHVPAHTILRVEDTEGNVVYQADAGGEAAMTANDARAVTLGLRGVIEGGTGGAAAIGRPAAGKTGTTQGGADGWFIGYTPDLVTASWIGRHDSNDPIDGLTGGGLPAAMWGRYMTTALEGIEASDFTMPDLAAYGVEPEPTEEPCPEGFSEGAPPEDAEVPPDGGPEDTGPVETRTEVAPGTEDREGGPCVRVVEVEPSPTDTDTDTETETETESPSPTETDTDTEPEVPLPTEQETTESPSPTEAPSPTAEPSPTETDGGGEARGASGGGSGDGSAPSPSPTATQTSPTATETTTAAAA